MMLIFGILAHQSEKLIDKIRVRKRINQCG